jgi:hypothetical protein
MELMAQLVTSLRPVKQHLDALYTPAEHLTFAIMVRDLYVGELIYKGQMLRKRDNVLYGCALECRAVS